MSESFHGLLVPRLRYFGRPSDTPRTCRRPVRLVLIDQLIPEVGAALEPVAAVAVAHEVSG